MNQRVFKIFFTWSVITPLFYMWFNIDTRGHKKAQKRQNIAVGLTGTGQLELSLAIIITLQQNKN